MTSREEIKKELTNMLQQRMDERQGRMREKQERMDNMRKEIQRLGDSLEADEAVVCELDILVDTLEAIDND